MMNGPDRDHHRRGARAQRPLVGRLDHMRDRLTQDGVLVVEMARDADADPKTRWLAAELAHIGADMAVMIARFRELHAEMGARGCSPHALGAPIPLVLKSRPEPFMPLVIPAEIGQVRP